MRITGSLMLLLVRLRGNCGFRLASFRWLSSIHYQQKRFRGSPGSRFFAIPTAQHGQQLRDTLEHGLPFARPGLNFRQKTALVSTGLALTDAVSGLKHLGQESLPIALGLREHALIFVLNNLLKDFPTFLAQLLDDLGLFLEDDFDRIVVVIRSVNVIGQNLEKRSVAFAIRDKIASVLCRPLSDSLAHSVPNPHIGLESTVESRQDDLLNR